MFTDDYAAWPVAARMYPNEHSGVQQEKLTASLPTFPTEVLHSLERIVELTEDEDVAERIESILREAQVFNSRTRPLALGEWISTDLLAIHIIQAAALYARAESLFTYARRKTEGVNSADLWDRTFAALSIMHVYEESVLEEAQMQKRRGNSPGEADTPEPH